MKLKVYFPSGKAVTYHNNIEALAKSFASAGIRYERVASDTRINRTPR